MSDQPTGTKRPISEAQLAANRANAAKSTGPRSEEGKKKSRLNGLTHGLRAETAVLPGEDGGRLQDRIDAWAVDLDARTEAEHYAVAAAARASWRMDRAVAADTAAVTRRMIDVEEGFDDRLAIEVDKLAERLHGEPGPIARQLRSTSHGCRWMIAQWKSLEAHLDAGRCLEAGQLILSAELMGKWLADFFTDPVVHPWMAAHAAMYAATTGADADQLLVHLDDYRPEAMDLREFVRHASAMIEALPDPATGLPTLRRTIAEHLADLTDRAELLELRERRDCRLAVECAKVDDSPEGMRRLRYEMSHERAYRAALKELRSLQARRPDLDPSAAPTEPISNPAPTEPISGPAPIEPIPDPAPTEPISGPTVEPIPDPAPTEPISGPTDEPDDEPEVSFFDLIPPLMSEETIRRFGMSRGIAPSGVSPG
jgi:hypothetical protein